MVELVTTSQWVSQWTSQWQIVAAVGVLTLLLLASRIYYAQRRFRQASLKQPKQDQKNSDAFHVMTQPSSVPPAVADLLTDPHPERVLEPLRAFQATVLDLARRGYVDFYSDTSKGRLGLVVNSHKARSSLKPFERRVLDFLRGASKRFSQAGYLDVNTFEGRLGLHLGSFLNAWRRDSLGWAVSRFNLPASGELYKQGLVVGFAFMQQESWQDAKRKRDVCYSIGRSFAALAVVALGFWFVPGYIPEFGIGLPLQVRVQLASVGCLAVTALGCWGLGHVAMVTIPAWRPEVADKIQQWRAFRRVLGRYRVLAKHAEEVLEQREKLATYAVALDVSKPFLRHLERLAKRHPDTPALSKASRWTDARDVSDFVWLVRMVQGVHARDIDDVQNSESASPATTRRERPSNSKSNNAKHNEADTRSR